METQIHYNVRGVDQLQHEQNVFEGRSTRKKNEIKTNLEISRNHSGDLETERRGPDKTGGPDEMATENEITVSIIAAKGQGKSVFLASELNKLKKGILLDTIGIFDPRSRFKTAVIPHSSYF